ncbi:WG repeat-containing protein [Aureispira anguillae]|uniref:WG repeat-containing protein n=1 Tax=Aureispira anguillae TaxID=2864201 RepID=A0A916DUI2_9BACT|nr:WG repeat-containing protein [Aureispira anguillae]BDS12266.1 WG repeat-containing protein [Aureispira anguillae]
MKPSLFLSILLYIGLCSCSQKEKLDHFNLVTKTFEVDGKNYSIDDFEDGICVISNKGLFGFVDSTGTLLCPFNYDTIFPFHHNRAIVVLNEKMGLVDKKGTEILAPSLQLIHPFTTPSISSFQDTNGVFGILNSSGEVLFKNKDFHWISPFHKGKATYSSSSQIGAIDSLGQLLPIYIPEYQFLHKIHLVELNKLSSLSFNNDLAPIIIRTSSSDFIHNRTTPDWPITTTSYYINNQLTIDSNFQDKTSWQYGFINKKGKIVVSPQYHKVSDFANGYAHVQNEKGWNVIDTTGQPLFKNYYAQLQIINEHWLIAKKHKLFSGSPIEDNLFGLINFKEETIIPFEYFFLKYLFEDLFCAQGNLVVNPIILQPPFSPLHPYTPHNMGVINTSLDTIMPFIYADIYAAPNNEKYIGYAKKITETMLIPVHTSTSDYEICNNKGYYDRFNAQGKVFNKKIPFAESISSGSSLFNQAFFVESLPPPPQSCPFFCSPLPPNNRKLAKTPYYLQ